MHRNPYYSKEEVLEQLDLYKPYLDIFKANCFKTISEWDGIDFLGHVTSNIEDVIKHLQTITKNQNHSILKSSISEVIKYYKNFITVIRLGLEGKRSESYEILSTKILTQTSFSFATFSEFTNYHINKAASDFVYRVRINDNTFNTNFCGKDLFHIPFEKRHLIGNNRFSLSGLPCLYFGNNVYCCWEELNRPKIEECFTSKFNLTGHSFIDLTIEPNRIDQEINSWYSKLEVVESSYESQVKIIEYYINDYLSIWPIIFCCSVRTFYKQSLFKPEYLFPQLLLEWLITSTYARFDGIKFFSTKDPLLKEKFDEVTLINYVIPTRVIKSSGFCEESSRKISYTEPVNFQIESILKNKIISNVYENEYKNSVFGNIESILAEKEFNFYK